MLIKAEYTVTFVNNPEMFGGSSMILTKAWYDNNLIYEEGKTPDIAVVVK